MVESQTNGQLITIGELSTLTGITTHTLRVWEKRYGTPEAIRLPSGHRRYPKKEIPRLRAIAKALESGYRASKVVRGTLEELQTLLGLGSPFSQPSSDDSFGITSNNWLKAVQAYDENKLIQGFYEVWGRLGPMTFIQDYAALFINQVDLSWQAGQINVAQEHFASECLGDFLSKKWRQLNQYNDGAAVMLTTLPEEVHQLGLLMCAVVTALTECKIIFLGPNTPYDDILSVVKQCQPKILCLSITKYAKTGPTEDKLYRLRSDLDKEVEIVIGGGGAIQSIPGITNFKNFNDYYDWLNKNK